MANVQHNTMTGSDLHEPKGVGSASANTLYVANGSGSGTWQKVSTTEVGTSIKNVNKVVLNITLDDLSTAESHYIVSPIAGDIEKIWTVIDGAIATGNVIITAKIETTPVTNGAVTINYSGSSAGTVDFIIPTGAKTVTAGQAIELAGDGGTDTSGAHAHVSILMDVA